MTRQQFIEALFDIDDLVAWGKNDAYCAYPKSPYPEMLHTDAVKFCINPLKGKRNGKNVTNINCLLFEMDKDVNGNIIPPKEQLCMFEASGLPFTTMTWSGTKSMHVIVRLERPVPEKWFRPLWKAIARVLVNQGLPIDPATMKIPQISRLPLSYRGDKLQRLIRVNKRVGYLELVEWLKLNGETIRLPRKPKSKPLVVNQNYSATSMWRFANKSCAKFNGEYRSYAMTGNHMWLFEFGKQCLRAGLTLDAALTISKQNWGDTYNTTATAATDIEIPIRKGYEWKQNKQ
tara:strand:+ start:1427 stop:2293 length:867 start_codon:yes stop_codon:yes gene_type:complete